MEIIINGESLDLPKGFSIDIEDTNPIFNDIGSQSIPATIPPTSRNMRILGMPQRLDSASDPNNPGRNALISTGAYIRRGKVNVDSASKRSGVDFNLGFDNSEIYAKCRNKRLCDLSDLPVYNPHPPYGSVSDLISHLRKVNEGHDEKNMDYAVFPVIISDDDAGREFLNVNVTNEERTVTRIVDGEATELTVPAGYGATAFLKVWRVLELIFADMGLSIKSNPFKNNAELSRLVVLNNCADACCTGSLKYADLMPDCTVSQFLNSLWSRFGLTYIVNFDKGMADLRLLRDILRQKGAKRLDSVIADFPVITYDNPQYIKLSANTGLSGAKPANERFEDFIKGLDISRVKIGYNVLDWQYNTKQQDWDRGPDDQIIDDWYDEAYEPDELPWDEPFDVEYPDYRDDEDRDDEDRDDGRDDDDRYSSRSAAPAAVTSSDDDTGTQSRTSTDSPDSDTMLAYNTVTSEWYKLDATNSKPQASSSSFFNWDPQPEGLEAMELASEDECVPIVKSKDACFPAYTVGPRHYHTHISGGSAEEGEADGTPLAFLFAYVLPADSAEAAHGLTAGRISPEGRDGLPITLADGTKPTISLYFQFLNGLYSNFWTEYDELLRHGNRSAEVASVMPHVEVAKIDMLRVYSVAGVRCLIDKAAYTIGMNSSVRVALTLRPIMPQGHYDWAKEMKLPDFSVGIRRLRWKIISYDTEALDTAALRHSVAKQYIADTGFTPHLYDEQYPYWGTVYVTPDSPRLRSVEEVTSPGKDKSLPTPTQHGQTLIRSYDCRLIYDIYGVVIIPNEPGEGYTPNPIGNVAIDLNSSATLRAEWTYR